MCDTQIAEDGTPFNDDDVRYPLETEQRWEFIHCIPPEQGALVPYTIADGGTSTTVYLTRKLSDQYSNSPLLSVEDILECGLLLLQTPQPDDTPRQKCRQVLADEIWVIEYPDRILFLEPNDM